MSSIEQLHEQFAAISTPLEQWKWIYDLQQSDINTAFKFLLKYKLECLPIIYTPTIGAACSNYSDLFPNAHSAGVFITREDKGKILEKLTKVHEEHPDVEVSVVTDGSRILGLGDLGAGGHLITYGKLGLYCFAAGFDPKKTLPVSIDVGCNIDAIREHPTYVGVRKHRDLPEQEYYDLVDEYFTAFKKLWPNAIFQFEDFSNNHAFDLLEKTRHRGQAVFNDDIQGTGCVCAANLLGALRGVEAHGMDGKVSNQRFLFYGMGAAGVGVAESMCRLMMDEGLTMDQARARFWFVDSRGLVHNKRSDFLDGSMQAHKLDFARVRDAEKDLKSLHEVAKEIRPTVLVGLSTIAKAFDRELLEIVQEHTKIPIILALSNPTVKCEITSEEAHDFCNGQVIYASGSPMPAIVGLDGKTKFVPSQANNLFVFGALGLGAFYAQATEITDNMIARAARALASQTSEEDVRIGICLPPLTQIREISAHIAGEVHRQAIADGVARCDKVLSDEEILSKMWVPQ